MGSTGYIRNCEMAKFSHSDGANGALIAFWGGESHGTKHMIDIAESEGLCIKIINHRKGEN